MIFKSPALPDLASEVSVSLQGASQIARPLGRSRIGFYRLFNDAALFHCHSACIYKTRTRKFLDFNCLFDAWHPRLRDPNRGRSNSRESSAGREIGE
jgi:hypothetical protein